MIAWDLKLPGSKVRRMSFCITDYQRRFVSNCSLCIAMHHLWDATLAAFGVRKFQFSAFLLEGLRVSGSAFIDDCFHDVG